MSTKSSEIKIGKLKNPNRRDPEKMSDEEKRMCNDLKKLDVRTDEEKKEAEKNATSKTTGEEIVDKYIDGKIEEKAFRRIHKVAEDPNKMQKDPYKRFMKAIAKGTLPTEGKFGQRFLLKLLDSLENKGSNEEKYVSKLLAQIEDGTRIITKDIAKDEVLKALEDTTKITDIDGIKSKVESVSKTQVGNWEVERAPKELVAKLDEYERRTTSLIDEEKSCKSEERKRQIDDEIDKIREEEAKYKKEFTDYLTRNLERFRAIRSYSKRLGFDINRAKKVAMKVNESTEIIKIDRVYFAREKTDYETTSPGELMVQFTSLKGDREIKENAGYKYFLSLMDTYVGHEEIDEPEEFNEKYGAEIGYKDVLELKGSRFSNKDEEFKVKDVVNKGGKWHVVLDKGVKIRNKNLIPYSVDSSLYSDLEEKEFKLGEFGAFLRKNDFRREITEEEDMQNFADKSQEEEKKECEELLAGLTPSQQEIFKGIGGIPTVTKRKLNKRDLLEAVNKGRVQRGNVEEEALEAIPTESENTEYKNSEPQVEQNQTKVKSSKKNYLEEALPYSEVFKAGGMEKVEVGLLKQMWSSTRFLSISDIWEMAKAMYEYYDRRWQRKQKDRYSSIGKELPFWAPEMQRISQATENEQVNQFKESFDQKGVWEIQDRVRLTKNRDELKAALIVLASKGQLRWDDIDFWKNLNRFVDPSLAVPIPSNGDPNTSLSETDLRTGYDFLKDAIDSLWGQGQYNEWARQNKSTYISNAKGFYEEGKELEGVQGGQGRRLGELLRQHKTGSFVDPQEYEGLILQAIEYGKGSMQDKIYFMIQGVAAQNKDGKTLLAFDRMAHLNSEMLVKFPVLEYLCARAPRSDGKSHRFTIDDYRQWAKWFDMGDPMNCKPTRAVDEFMWKYAIPSDDTQNRINKALRHGENLDHDDMFAYLPPATEEVVTDTCKAIMGSKKFLTIEGYANVFPGFSQYIRSLATHNKREKLVEAVKSYIRFEGIMSNKFEKSKTAAEDKYQRLGPSTMNSSTIVSTTPPAAYIGQLNKAIQAVIMAYNDPELNSIADIIFNTQVGDLSQKYEQEKQNRVNDAYHRFGQVFHKVIKSDNGERMTAILDSANLEGMTYMSSEEKEVRKEELKARKAEYQNEMSLNY
jgi:hypothetical protein